LLPLYLELDAMLAPTLAGKTVEAPPLVFPLAARVAYRRADGAQLALLHDGTAVAGGPAGNVVSATLPLPAGVISTTTVISLTEAAIASGALQAGAAAFVGDQAASGLLVRGPAGMLETVWEAGPPDAALAPLVAVLDTILDTLLAGTEPEPAAGSPTSSPTGGAASTPAAAPSRTPTPSP
jgi:hypothetical protein